MRSVRLMGWRIRLTATWIITTVKSLLVVCFQPFKSSSLEVLQGLGVGLAGTYGDQQGSGARLLVVLGPRAQPSSAIAQMEPGWHHYRQRYSLAGLATGVLLLRAIRAAGGICGVFPARATWYHARDVQNEAWQVAGSYVLTGENASYRSVSRPSPSISRKAPGVHLNSRLMYGEFTVDKDAFPFFANPTRAARIAKSWGLGLNWYLNRNVKFQLNYEQTDFTGGSASGERPKERALLSRFQVAF